MDVMGVGSKFWSPFSPSVCAYVCMNKCVLIARWKNSVFIVKQHMPSLLIWGNNSELKKLNIVFPFIKWMNRIKMLTSSIPFQATISLQWTTGVALTLYIWRWLSMNMPKFLTSPSQITQLLAHASTKITTISSPAPHSFEHVNFQSHRSRSPSHFHYLRPSLKPKVSFLSNL